MNTNTLNDYFSVNIRNERFNFGDGSKLIAKINNKSINLENISDSGISFSSQEKFDNKNERLGIFYDERILIDLELEYVWKKKDTYGYRFLNEILAENFILNLKSAIQISVDLKKQRDSVALIEPIFLENCLLLLDYLDELKEKCSTFESTIYIQSLEAKEKAYDLAIELFGLESINIIKTYAHQIDKVFSKIDDKKSRVLHGDFFRKHLGKYFIEAAFTGRAFHKPRGYAGDYEMMNQIYRNVAEGNSLFEKIIHLYGINESSSESVRLRKNYLKEKLLNLSKKQQGKIIVGSLACGPSREVFEFIKEQDQKTLSMYKFILMDQDHHALLNARRNILKAANEKNLTVDVSFLPLSVKQILEFSEEAKVLEIIKFDLLYTAGLYDYLPQGIAKNLTKIITRSVIKGGEFIIGNFHPDNPTKTISDLVADWRLIHRDEKQMEDLISDCDFTSHKFYFDKLRIDLFVEAIM